MNFLLSFVFLAQAAAPAAPADPMIPGSMVIALVTAVIGAVGAAWAKKAGREEGKKEASLERTITNNPLETKEVPDWATREDIDELRGEIKDLALKMERNFETERETARIAIGNAHKRIDAESKVAATLMGKVEEIGQNVSRLLNMAMIRNKS